MFLSPTIEHNKTVHYHTNSSTATISYSVTRRPQKSLKVQQLNALSLQSIRPDGTLIHDSGRNAQRNLSRLWAKVHQLLKNAWTLRSLFFCLSIGVSSRRHSHLYIVVKLSENRKFSVLHFTQSISKILDVYYQILLTSEHVTKFGLLAFVVLRVNTLTVKSAKVSEGG